MPLSLVSLSLSLSFFKKYFPGVFTARRYTHPSLNKNFQFLVGRLQPRSSPTRTLTAPAFTGRGKATVHRHEPIWTQKVFWCTGEVEGLWQSTRALGGHVAKPGDVPSNCIPCLIILEASICMYLTHSHKNLVKNLLVLSCTVFRFTLLGNGVHWVRGGQARFWS